MQRLTEGLSTKADKIRLLAREGYARQQIADFLGIRYQHVRNVLVDDERKARSALGPPPADWPADLEYKSATPPEKPGFEDAANKSSKPLKTTVKVKLDSNGRLAIPPHMLEALGWKDGDTVWVNFEGNGEIRLADASAVTRRIQAWAKTLNLPSVDEYLAERQREREQEEQRMRRWLGETDTKESE